MSRLSTANTIFATVFLLSLIAAIGNDVQVVKRYGWVYDKTTIIGDDVSTETINMNITVWNYLFMGLLTLILFQNSRNINAPFTLYTESTEITGIDFLSDKPENWHVDIADDFIGVKINKYHLVIPRNEIEVPDESP